MPIRDVWLSRLLLLQELGRTRDLDLKQLLQQVASYTDDVQASCIDIHCRVNV